MNPGRDVTNKALQYRYLSAVLTDLINGLDTRLRGYDKTFSHKLLRRNDNDKTEIKEKMGECLRNAALPEIHLQIISSHANF
ncbi:MAG: hypothetical protein RBS43_06565 [Candidatus Cloacimonas sp.]|jgi:hypothetical protein|nr:hypothetical protein [Candidatus Cloacimonas sp.]